MALKKSSNQITVKHCPQPSECMVRRDIHAYWMYTAPPVPRNGWKRECVSRGNVGMPVSLEQWRSYSVWSCQCISLYPTSPSSAVGYVAYCIHWRLSLWCRWWTSIKSQSGTSDYGLYAIAGVLAPCSELNPCTWVKGLACKYLSYCLNFQRQTPFPSAAKPQQIFHEVKQTLKCHLCCMPENKHGKVKCSKSLECYIY